MGVSLPILNIGNWSVVGVCYVFVVVEESVAVCRGYTVTTEHPEDGPYEAVGCFAGSALIVICFVLHC
jgi:hypothetical protein